MSFTSSLFLLFFPVTVGCIFCTPRRFRWVTLLIASYLFYMSWKPFYVLLLASTTLVDYYAARFLFASIRPGVRRGWLLLSFCSNLGVLVYFKYANFFAASGSEMLHFFGWSWSFPSLHVVLPVAISFYTFQSLSYMMDVYRGVCPAEKHLGLFALYTSFFPQLVAGPIERAPHLLPQFREMPRWDTDNFFSGLSRMLTGFFKKIVIADSLARIINPLYADPQLHSGASLFFATILFSFQIYCDFSGYSDIAIGAAKVMGFSLRENFLHPYAAFSVADFWRRWHISLSSWFRDYLYIPLGGNRKGLVRQCGNLLFVFLISGLWHGASWTFVIWGGLHGLYLVIGLLTLRLRTHIAAILGMSSFPRLHHFLRVSVTYALVTFAWIFFRAATLRDALYIVTHLFSGFSVSVSSVMHAEYGVALWAVIVISVLLFWLWEALVQSTWAQWIASRPVYLRWGIYYLAIILLLGSGKPETFLYFQF
ncbi:MAG: MBOAT family O-acyltransferase [Candidatus Peregrinibacteria bacterium]